MSARQDESPLREVRPPRKRGRRAEAEQRGRHASRRSNGPLSRAGRYMLLGSTCLTPALLLYFGGGYLFVAAYNEEYPFVRKPVGPFEGRIFYYIGPVLFFVGLVAFVLSYAMICKGIDYIGRR